MELRERRAVAYDPSRGVLHALHETTEVVRAGAYRVHPAGGVVTGMLVSRAHNPEDEPQTVKTAEKGERVALVNLMASAIGSYKKPSSHRRIEIETEEARDMIMLASHLLRIVDSRRPR